MNKLEARKPVDIAQVIEAGYVLHNFVERRNQPYLEDLVSDPEGDMPQLVGDPDMELDMDMEVDELVSTAGKVREGLVQFINTDEGCILWKHSYEARRSAARYDEQVCSLWCSEHCGAQHKCVLFSSKSSLCAGPGIGPQTHTSS